MKKAISLTGFKKYMHSIFVIIFLLFISFTPCSSLAQADSSQKKEPVTKDEAILISPSIDFKSVQKGDNSIDLKAALKAKIKGNAYKLSLLKVTFVQVTDSAEKNLGFVITDLNGKASLNIKADALKTGKEGILHFKAIFAGNKQMAASEEEVTFKRGRLEIVPVKEDSLLTVKVKMVDLATGADTAVSEIALGIFVKRLFNPLKIGEGTTDENGVVTVEIPKGLPGDVNGNITLLAKIDENEIYGNLEASATQKWGIPVSDKLNELPRALWSAHPPVWMMVTFAILMITVWGHYFVIIFELIRLRKEEPHTTMKPTAV